MHPLADAAMLAKPPVQTQLYGQMKDGLQIIGVPQQSGSASGADVLQGGVFLNGQENALSVYTVSTLRGQTSIAVVGESAPGRLALPLLEVTAGVVFLTTYLSSG